ncbi:MAG TPA: T9SS type A sorting domain-containing protein [Bacteroidia bacterium]|jgi:hypothetical protein|nr:T9SS type A sorting domain-containing protein [Bacteroidia bacterium]
MKKFLYLFYFVILAALCNSQNYYYNNASTGNAGQSIIDKDTNMFLYHGNRLEKYDKNFIPLWEKTYSGINFQNILLSKTGSLYFLSGDSVFGKLNADGSIAWTKAVSKGVTLIASTSATISMVNFTSGFSTGSLFLDRNGDLIITGSIGGSGFPMGCSQGFFFKCDTLGIFKKASLFGPLYTPYDPMGIVGMKDSLGYYKLLYQVEDNYAYPSFSLYWGQLTYSDYTDSLVAMHPIGLITGNLLAIRTFKSKIKDVYYKITTFSAGPSTGIIVCKERNDCQLWRFETYYSNSYSFSNIDEDEKGNVFITLSEGYPAAGGFMRIDSNGICNGNLIQYNGISGSWARVFNFNNYFIDGDGASLSNLLLIGKFDSTLNIACTSTVNLSPLFAGYGCGSSSAVPKSYSISSIPFVNYSATVTSVSNFSINPNFCLTLGTKEISGLEDNITVYPNPANEKIHLANKENVRVLEISLFDLYGKQILKCDNCSYLDISKFATGIYLLKINTQNGEIHKTIIKQ